jgi:bifunctional DNA-binding transcriptional regulator/antitoxin component of YhaV-PrlF toxin-antitoxin module
MRTRISAKHQITIPSTPFRAAELRVGDRLHAEADRLGRIVLTRIEELIEHQSTLAATPADRSA